MIKRWYHSRSMWIQIIQTLQAVSGLITAQYFPDSSPQILGAMAIATVVLSKLQMYIRSLPDHGDSITMNQEIKRHTTLKKGV